jgi:hypothetical protein
VYNAWKNGTPAERIRISRQQLRDNPHLAAYHFHRRFLAIMECVIKPKFEVTDWWNRYEFQARASSHSHGFMWTKNGPVLVIADHLSRDAFVDFWGEHVSAVLPLNVDRTSEERTMMSILPEDNRNTLRQLDILVNAL